MGITRVKDLYKALISFLNSSELDVKKLKPIKSDGAPVMVVTNKGLVQYLNKITSQI
jgi:hypothetical protein